VHRGVAELAGAVAATAHDNAVEHDHSTKNSSLAIAIGYMDIVATIGGISLMQTGKEMETMIIVLLTYLVISLSIAAFMNWYNDRTKLVER
jgi:general L-amino acid transport system permease protein